jgi:hypothetical protein
MDDFSPTLSFLDSRASSFPMDLFVSGRLALRFDNETDTSLEVECGFEALFDLFGAVEQKLRFNGALRKAATRATDLHAFGTAALRSSEDANFVFDLAICCFVIFGAISGLVLVEIVSRLERSTTTTETGLTTGSSESGTFFEGRTGAIAGTESCVSLGDAHLAHRTYLRSHLAEADQIPLTSQSLVAHTAIQLIRRCSWGLELVQRTNPY